MQLQWLITFNNQLTLRLLCQRLRFVFMHERHQHTTFLHTGAKRADHLLWSNAINDLYIG